MMSSSILIGALAASLAAAPGRDCPSLKTFAPAEAGEGVMASTVMGAFKRVAPPRRVIPLPEGALETVRITFSRSNCLGTCPSYQTVLLGDGRAVYTGKQFVLVTGDHAFTVPADTIRCLVGNFQEANFWALRDHYVSPVTDSPFYSITLEIGGRRKTVTDYVGVAVGMSPAVTQLEAAIDQAGARRWTVGDDQTIAALEAEHFDFRSPEAGAILARAASDGPEDMALALIARGAPVDGRAQGLRDDSALENAARAGRPALMRALIAKGAGVGAGEADALLWSAVASGTPAAVAVALDLKPDLAKRGEAGKTVLMTVADARYSKADKAGIDQPGVAGLLLAAGADPKARADTGETALFWQADGALVRLLLAAGADLEARDEEGRTPLLTADTDDAALALVDAGADLAAAAKDGDTIFKSAVQYHYPKTLAALRARGVTR